VVLIGELARQAGTTAKTLRFYEDEGLLPAPDRTPSGYRDYPEEALDRVAFIRDAQAAGLTLRQIGQIMDIRDSGRPPCEHVGELIADRLADVARRIIELEQTRARLEELARRTGEVDPADCSGFCEIIQQPATGDRS
jgi:DNA-binding transcriptional MerR regulator